LNKVHQWLGNLFYRGAQPADLEEMTYQRLKYWNNWHEVYTKEEKAAMNRKGKK